MTKIDKKTSSKKKAKKKHEHSEALKKWKEECIKDDKLTFGIRLSESVQFEIRRAAKASGNNISQYIQTIHDESVKKKDYSLLMYIHDKNKIVRLLKLAFLFPRALSITEKWETIDRIRSRPEFWVDPIIAPPPNQNYKYPRVEDNIPRMFVIIKNYECIQKFVTKNKMPIKAPREVVYGKERKTGAMFDEQEGYELKCKLKPFEKQIEDKYIEIFEILKKLKELKEIESSSLILDELDHQYSQAYLEVNELLDEG